MEMRASMHPAPADGDRSTDREHRSVLEHLARWEDRSLLTHEEADAIRGFERAESREAPRVPVIAEVVAYLGAALAVAAGFALVGPRWDELSHAQRLVGAGVIAVGLLAAGWFLRSGAEPAVRRLAGVLWTMSVGAAAGFIALLVFDLPAGTDPASWAVLALGVGSGLYALVLLRLRPCAPLQVALYACTLVSVAGAGVWAIDAGWSWLDRMTGWFGWAMVAVSAAWIVAGTFDVLLPRGTALAVGSAGTAIAPFIAFANQPEGVGLLLGVAVAVSLLAASTFTRNVPMLALGAMALFAYLVGAVVHYLADSIGVPFALLLSGVALLGVAVVVMRLRRFTGARPGTSPDGVR